MHKKEFFIIIGISVVIFLAISGVTKLRKGYGTYSSEKSNVSSSETSSKWGKTIDMTGTQKEEKDIYQKSDTDASDNPTVLATIIEDKSLKQDSITEEEKKYRHFGINSPEYYESICYGIGTTPNPDVEMSEVKDINLSRLNIIYTEKEILSFDKKFGTKIRVMQVKNPGYYAEAFYIYDDEHKETLPEFIGIIRMPKNYVESTGSSVLEKISGIKGPCVKSDNLTEGYSINANYDLKFGYSLFLGSNSNITGFDRYAIVYGNYISNDKLTSSLLDEFMYQIYNVTGVSNGVPLSVLTQWWQTNLTPDGKTYYWDDTPGVNGVRGTTSYESVYGRSEDTETKADSSAMASSNDSSNEQDSNVNISSSEISK